MRWSEGRQTTEKEDRAYCLTVIFGVSIPPNYGEGDYAFDRLINEIKTAMQTSLSKIPAPWTMARLPSSSPISTPGHRQSLLDSLRFEQMDAGRITIKAADGSTCEWFMSHTAYVNWLRRGKTDGPGFLWLIGNAGVGKSTLMRFALHSAENLRTCNEHVISFFFNARGGSLEQSTEGLYRALLWQLLDQATDLQELIDDLPRQDWTLNSLRYLLSRAVNHLQHRRLRCFIDALDECPDEEAIRDMISFIEDLATQSDARLYVCFASRHYPTIDIRHGERVIFEEQAGHELGIRRYVRKHLQAGKGKKAEELENHICSKANKIFLWVVIVVGILNTEYRRGSIFRVRQRLHKLPPELSCLFRDILLRDGANKSEMLLALQWILFAARPLSKEEFYFGMAAGMVPETENIGPWDRDEGTLDKMAQYVRDATKGLAEMTRSKKPKVQFIHESVRDYLIKEDGMNQLWPDLGSSLQARGHYELSRCCRSYIATGLGSYENLIFDLPMAVSEAGEELRDGLTRDFPFIQYVIEFTWQHHDKCLPFINSDIAQGVDIERYCALNNALVRQDNQRYPPGVSLPYILAESGLTRLLSTLPGWSVYQSIMDGSIKESVNPLFAAVANGHYEALMVLLASKHETGASGGYVSYSREEVALATIRDESYCTLLYWAARWGWADVARLLIRVSPQLLGRPNDEMKTPLHQAAYFGHEDVFQTLLDNGADVSAQDEKGWTAVHFASAAGRANILKLLSTSDVDWDRVDHGGCTPLLLASDHDYYDALRFLLSKGVDIEKEGGKDPSDTPLCRASRLGHMGVVQVLLEAGADPNKLTADGEIALLSRQSEELTQLLINYGADVDAKHGKDGASALHRASACSNGAVLQVLLDSKANIHSRDNWGQTALHQAKEGYCISLLLDHGADIKAQDAAGRTALHIACMLSESERVDLLLKRGADIEAPDGDGRTPFLYACLCGDDRFAKFLLARGAIAAAVDFQGDTALHYACIRGDLFLAQNLLYYGVSPTVVNNNGQSPRDLAGEGFWSRMTT